MNQRYSETEITKLENDKSEKFDGQGRFRHLDVHMRWATSIKNYLEKGKLHINNPRLVEFALFYTDKPAFEFVLNWRTRNSQETLVQPLDNLEKEFIPLAGKEKLYKKFQCIKQEEGGRIKPIVEVIEQLQNLQLLLPHVTDTKLYFTFKDAMEPQLCANLKPKIDEDTLWAIHK